MESDLNEALASLKPKGKDSHSVSVLSRWIAEAENQIGEGRSERLSEALGIPAAVLALERS